MTFAFLIPLGLAIFGMWCFWTAPDGYEDERGFHLRTPPGEGD